MQRIVLGLLLAALSGLVAGQTVYRVVQPDGTVEFTDSPPPGQAAQAMDVRPLNTVPLQGSPRDAYEDVPQQKSKPVYESLTITRPREGDSLWGTGGTVKVDIKITPSLRVNDRIDIVMDGISVGGGRSTAITLTQVYRGTHELQAIVKDDAGKVMIQSNTVSFTIHQATQRRLLN